MFSLIARRLGEALISSFFYFCVATICYFYGHPVPSFCLLLSDSAKTAANKRGKKKASEDKILKTNNAKLFSKGLVTLTAVSALKYFFFGKDES